VKAEEQYEPVTLNLGEKSRELHIFRSLCVENLIRHLRA